MLPGPVFNVELVTTARRARYYVLRFFYGAILLCLVWQNDPAHYTWYYGPVQADMTLQQTAQLGDWLFRSFAVAQSIVILLVTPALLGGVIADEKQRKTLHYLLASRLTGAEIVLGKLCARLLHVGVLVGVGFPVLSLLSLFGGVQPELIALTFLATMTTTVFVASLSILVSVYARRSREAIGSIYALELVWLFFPIIIAEVLPLGGWPWDRIYEWIRPLNDWIGSSGPLYAATRAPFRLSGQGALEAYARMVGLQAVGTVLFLTVAVMRLRPIYRKQADVSRWAARFGAWKQGRRLLPRPACGDDAMLWKERYVSRTSVLMKVTGGVVVLVIGGVLVYTAWDTAAPAFKEVFQYGYGSGTNHEQRDLLNTFVRMLSGLTYLAWLLGVASAASSGVVYEREADTWTSLIATPLGGLEIVRAKIIGAVWGTRWLGVVLLCATVLGLAAGAVHPLGFVASSVETVIFIWFASALGTLISLRARNSGRAMTATVGVLLLLNGGYLLCCLPVRANTAFVALGVTPAIQATSLVRYDELQVVFGPQYGPYWNHRYWEWAVTCVVGTLAYGVAAFMLTVACVAVFDDVAGRPRRFGQFPPPDLPPTDKIASDAGVEFLD